ncbi:MAG: hypothetical protein OEM84_13240 [Acidimicrobiia bacterium]|nr:hypothetical protein [Acidimicrobiia bacterium]
MGIDVRIGRYLDELDRGLRPLGRRRRARIVAEARDHLLELATDDEAGAVDRFGSIETVVAAHLVAAGRRAPRRSIIAFGLAGLAYGAVQAVGSPATFGLFPPGPWPNDVPPQYLAWKVDLAGALVGVAFLIGLAAIAVWVTRRRDPLDRQTLAAYLALTGSVVFAASWPFETIFLFQRAEAVAGSPPAAVVGMVCVALALCHVAALGVASRALRIVRAASADTVAS